MNFINRITDYVKQREGKPVHINEMSRALNLSYEQIRQAISSKRNVDKTWDAQMITIARGATWMWRTIEIVMPTNMQRSLQDELTYTFVSALNNGDLILQNNKGALYRATELN